MNLIEHKKFPVPQVLDLVVSLDPDSRLMRAADKWHRDFFRELVNYFIWMLLLYCGHAQL
jgi:hypothetical protein